MLQVALTIPLKTLDVADAQSALQHLLLSSDVRVLMLSNSCKQLLAFLTNFMSFRYLTFLSYWLHLYLYILKSGRFLSLKTLKKMKSIAERL